MTNYARIQSAAKEMQECEDAISWLEQYGRGLTERGDSIGISINLNHASACPGAHVAAKVLLAYTRLEIPKIVETAIVSCRNTIVIDREAIADELVKSEPVE